MRAKDFSITSTTASITLVKLLNLKSLPQVVNTNRLLIKFSKFSVLSVNLAQKNAASLVTTHRRGSLISLKNSRRLLSLSNLLNLWSLSQFQRLNPLKSPPVKAINGCQGGTFILLM
jgi:hypothetical protein